MLGLITFCLIGPVLNRGISEIDSVKFVHWFFFSCKWRNLCTSSIFSSILWLCWHRDFVPAQNVKENVEVSIALCSLYLLFGIALLAMSFNLVQEEVINSVKSVAKRLGIIKDEDEEDNWHIRWHWHPPPSNTRTQQYPTKKSVDRCFYRVRHVTRVHHMRRPLVLTLKQRT